MGLQAFAICAYKGSISIVGAERVIDLGHSHSCNLLTVNVQDPSLHVNTVAHGNSNNIVGVIQMALNGLHKVSVLSVSLE